MLSSLSKVKLLVSVDEKNTMDLVYFDLGF